MGLGAKLNVVKLQSSTLNSFEIKIIAWMPQTADRWFIMIYQKVFCFTY